MHAGTSVDLYKLSHLVAFAELRNVTRAAEELGLSQQALSNSLRQTENAIGVELFRRVGRKLELTAAGEVLAVQAVPLLAAAESLVRSTITASEHVASAFVVGHTPAITPDEVFDLVAPVRVALPSTTITARQLYPDEIAPALFAGRIDVGLRRGATTPPDLAAAVVAYSSLSVAMNSTHALAERDSLVLQDLQDQTLMLWGEPGRSFYSDFLLSILRRFGFEPATVVNTVHGTTPTTAVIGNHCVSLVTAEPGLYHRGRVRVLEVVDPPQVPTQALWLRHTVSEARAALLGGQRSGEPN